MPDKVFYVIELLIVIYPVKKAWSFSMSISVPHGCCHLTGLSIMVSSAFHRHSSNLAKSLSWWSDSSRSNNYSICITIMSTRRPSEEDKTRSFFFLFHTQARVSVMFAEWATHCFRDQRWERGYPGLAYQWPQWQMCCLIRELAAAPAGLNIKWFTVSRRENAPSM